MTKNTTLIPLVLVAVFAFSPGDLTGGELEDLRTEIEYSRDRNERREAAIGRIKASIEKMSGDYEERAEDLLRMDEASRLIEEIGGQAKELENSIRRQLAVLKFYESKAGIVDVETGSEFPEVALKSGRVLTGVKINKLEGDKVKLRHSGGFIDVAVTELPESVTGNMLLAPEGHEISGLPYELFKKRPESMTNLDIFASVRSLEKEEAGKRRAAATAAANLKRKQDLADYRSKQLAVHEKFVAERKERDQQRETQRQAVVEKNKEIDKQLEALRQQLAAVEVQSKKLEISFNEKIAGYDGKIGRNAPMAERKRRKDNVAAYYDAKDALNEKASQISAQMLKLQAQKR